MAYVSTAGSRLTTADQKALDVWGIRRDYWTYRDDLIRLGKRVYIVTEQALSTPPTPDQFYALYSPTLRKVNVFLEFARDLRFPSVLYDYFASLLAKYVVENDWTVIRR